MPDGLLRARFWRWASFDSTVRILSLANEDCLQTMGVQALAAAPSSLLLLTTQSGDVYLNAGLANGVLLRADVDSRHRSIRDTRARFLGARPPALFPTTTRGAPAMLALSSKPWLGHVDLEGRFTLSPLSYDALEHAAPFASEQCPEGIVASSGNTLRVVAVERLGESFNADLARS